MSTEETAPHHSGDEFKHLTITIRRVVTWTRDERGIWTSLDRQASATDEDVRVNTTNEARLVHSAAWLYELRDAHASGRRRELRKRHRDDQIWAAVFERVRTLTARAESPTAGQSRWTRTIQILSIYLAYTDWLGQPGRWTTDSSAVTRQECAAEAIGRRRLNLA